MQYCMFADQSHAILYVCWPITCNTVCLQQADDLVDTTLIFHELRETHREYLLKSNEYDKLLEDQTKSTQDIQMLYQAHDSFKELVKVFEEQLELHKINSKNIAAHEYNK